MRHYPRRQTKTNGQPAILAFQDVQLLNSTHVSTHACAAGGREGEGSLKPAAIDDEVSEGMTEKAMFQAVHQTGLAACTAELGCCRWSSSARAVLPSNVHISISILFISKNDYTTYNIPLSLICNIAYSPNVLSL